MARKAISKKVRFEVFKRDAFTCQYCGAKSPDAILVVDHIKPVFTGGGNDITNLNTACQPCNAGKGATELYDYSAIGKQHTLLREKAQLAVATINGRFELSEFEREFEREWTRFCDEFDELLIEHGEGA